MDLGEAARLVGEPPEASGRELDLESDVPLASRKLGDVALRAPELALRDDLKDPHELRRRCADGSGRSVNDARSAAVAAHNGHGAQRTDGTRAVPLADVLR